MIDENVQEGTFWGNGNILHLDWGGGYKSICMCLLKLIDQYT